MGEVSANCVVLGNLQEREKGRRARAAEDFASPKDGREGAAGEPFVHSMCPAVLSPGRLTLVITFNMFFRLGLTLP